MQVHHPPWSWQRPRAPRHLLLSATCATLAVTSPCCPATHGPQPAGVSRDGDTNHHFRYQMQCPPLRTGVRKIQAMAGQTRKRVIEARVLVGIVQCTRSVDRGSCIPGRRTLKVPLLSVLVRSSLREKFSGASLYRTLFCAYPRPCTRAFPVDRCGNI